MAQQDVLNSLNDLIKSSAIDILKRSGNVAQEEVKDLEMYCQAVSKAIEPQLVAASAGDPVAVSNIGFLKDSVVAVSTDLLLKTGWRERQLILEKTISIVQGALTALVAISAAA